MSEEAARDELETEKSTRHRSLVCKDKTPLSSSARVISSTASRQGDAHLPTFHPPRPPGPLPRTRTRAFIPRASERLVFVVRVSLVRLVVHEASAPATSDRKAEHRKHHPTATTNKTNVRYLGVGRCRAREESRRVGGGNERAKGDDAVDKTQDTGGLGECGRDVRVSCCVAAAMSGKCDPCGHMARPRLRTGTCSM